MPTLTVVSRVTACQDSTSLALPLQRYVDWSRTASKLPISEVLSQRHVIEPGAQMQLASLPFVSGFQAGATYDFKAHPAKPGRYQVRYVGGAVQNPLAQLGSGLATVGVSYSVTASAGGTITLVNNDPAATSFGLGRGDVVYLAGPAFDDSGVFGFPNQGFWVVVSCSSFGSRAGAQVLLRRGDATDPVGTTETVTAAGTLDIQKVSVLSAVLLAGAPSYQGVWPVVEAASGWFSISTLAQLPDLLAQPVTSMALVEEFVGYVRIEVDQPASVAASAGDLLAGTAVLRPVLLSDPMAPPLGGWWEQYGFVTSLVVQNLADVPLSLNVILAYMVA